MSESRGSTARPAPVRLRTRLARSKGGRAAKETLVACFRYRVMGLAAEAAYFTVLSLPPLIFGLAGLIGFVASAFDVGEVASFQRQVLVLAGRVVTTDVVDGILAPTLDSVLSQGSAAVVSIGFVVALWSGSRAVNVFVDTITIMYGLAGRRGFVQQRLLSFVFYLALMLISVVLVPLVLAGPGLVKRILPARLEFLGGLYWPVVLVAGGLFLAGVYNRSIPLRSRWRSGLPGAALSLLIWVLGSVLLRVVLNASSGSTTIYGPLAAPIAVLIWLYIMSLAVLVGAAFNAAVDDVWPRLSGIDHDQEDRDPAPGRPASQDAGTRPEE